MAYQKQENVFLTAHIKLYELKTGDSMWPGLLHGHEYVQIWYVLDGSCAHFVQGQTYVLEAGSLFMIPPNVEHKIDVINSNCHIYGVDFPIELILEDNVVSEHGKYHAKDFFGDNSFEQKLEKVYPCCVVPESERYKTETRFKRMSELYTKMQPYYVVGLKADLLQLLLDIFRFTEQTDSVARDKNKYLEDINRVKLYIAENLSEKLYIGDIAKVAKLSVSSFSTYFKQYTGQSLVTYINTLRIDMAKRLILETDLSIREICYNTGFNDMAYFTKVFKRETQTTPGAFRTRNRSNEK